MIKNVSYFNQFKNSKNKHKKIKKKEEKFTLIIILKPSRNSIK